MWRFLLGLDLCEFRDCEFLVGLVSKVGKEEEKEK